MKPGPLYREVVDRCSRGMKQYWILLDPDDFDNDRAAEVARAAEQAGVHAVLVGGSLLYSRTLDEFIQELKSAVSIPVIIFPGDAGQLSRFADAVLYLSLVSGRNPGNLIGEHVKAAPIIREMGIEPVSTAYMLVESGNVSSVEFMSNTRPLPRNKPSIAAAHALAAQYIGMSLVYLEAGSGATLPVPPDMIAVVRKIIDVPLIVGGGIRSEKAAHEALTAGADIIVTGNMLQQKDGISLMRRIAETTAAASNRSSG